MKKSGVRILHHDRNFFPASSALELHLVEDPWGSWGGMNEEKDSFCLETVREKWTLTKSVILESGPLRAKLWTRWQGKNSWIDLTFSTAENDPLLKIDTRLLWNERSARLKLVIPCRGTAEFDVPGSQTRRATEGQLPMGRWVRRTNQQNVVGFASDRLGDVDLSTHALRITLARATRYATMLKPHRTKRCGNPQWIAVN